LEPEPRVKASVPRPDTSPLDKLARLDKYNRDKNFGLDGKGFRTSHAQSLNFFKYRKANTVGRPRARFAIVEDDFWLKLIGIYIFRSQLQKKIFPRRPLLTAVMIIV